MTAGSGSVPSQFKKVAGLDRLHLPYRGGGKAITAIHAAAAVILKRPQVSKRMQDIVCTAVGDAPEEFAAFITSEMAKWGKVVRGTGLTEN